MFSILSAVIIIAALAWLINFLKKNNLSLAKAISNNFNYLKNSFKEIKQIKINNFSKNLDLVKNFIYLSTMFLFIIMAISAFIPVILGDTLSGLFLLVHVAVAPVISVLLAILVILFAHSNFFTKDDLQQANETRILKFTSSGYKKLSFWLIIFLSIPAMVSIILNMFPLFGTEGQVYLLAIHKYCTLLILLLVIFHSGYLIVSTSKNSQ